MKLPGAISMAVLAIVVVHVASEQAFEHQSSPAGATAYDTAIALLRDFVVLGNDHGLGFANDAELAGVMIDTNDGIPVYALSKEGLSDPSARIDSNLPRTSRTLFPVYSAGRLRAAITFDSTGHGWAPVDFEDSTAIAPILHARRNTTAANVKGARFFKVEIQDAENSMFVEETADGKEQIVLPPEFAAELAEEHLVDSPPRIELPEPAQHALEQVGALVKRLASKPK